MIKKYINSLSVFLLIIFVGFIPIVDLFHTGLPQTHDGQDHVARIANFYQNLSEGNIVPRWAANLNWGYGHPILMFLYPLPSYSVSLVHFLGFSLIDSLKIIFGFTFIVSGLSMYIWVKEFLGREAGVMAAILYLFAPYRFVDLYVRGAIGEHVAFIFPPLVCYFLLKVSKNNSYWHVVGGSFSIAGLILSHNAITIMFLPVIALYALYLLYKNNFKKITLIYYMVIVFLGFGLSSFFLLPAFLEGKYTLRDIVTKGVYRQSFVLFRDFFFGEWNYGGTGKFTVQVGIVQWLFIFLSLPVVAVLRKRGNSFWIMVIGTIIIFWFTLFIMTAQSDFIWKIFTLLQKFQFPWRFLSVVVFVTSLLGGFFIFIFPKRLQQAAVVLFVIIVLLVNKDYWHANGYLVKDQNFFTGIYYGTTDTGESAPIWSVRFMEQPAKSRIEVIGGKASVVENKRTSTRHEYSIDVTTNTSQLRENTLYFPGWKVLVDNKQTPIEYQSQVNRGVITFFIDQGKHTVITEFTDTKLRLFANAVSVFSLATIVFSYILRKRKIWQHFQ